MSLSLLDRTKIALAVNTNAYDGELSALIDAAKLDLGIAGVELPSSLDALCERAIITYCKFQFSALTDGEYAHTKASYDEQKAQLSMATGYTDWGDA